MNFAFLKDRDFVRTMLKIGLPITLQHLLVSSVNMLDVLMIGQLGEISIAAVGLANQVFFLHSLFVYGISSGLAIFAAQYWGKKDIPNIKRVLGLTYGLSLIVGTLFTLAAALMPETILRFYTTDAMVIELGAGYLRIVAVSYLFYTITASLNVSMRATEDVAIPTTISVIALAMKFLINYSLILGNFGLPALGIKGAAIGTVITHIVESMALLIAVYARKTPQAARIKEMLDFDWDFFKKTTVVAMPAMLNEVLWSIGITIYNSIYSHISTESIAAVQIVGTIESIAFVAFFGMGNACAVMIGNQIGAGNEEKARSYANQFRWMVAILSMLVGGVLILLRSPILSLYELGDAAYNNAFNLMLMSGLMLWLRTSNFTLFIGILRAGGDTRYALILETFAVWLIAIPLGYMGAFVLHLPVYWVYLMISTEELFKQIIGSGRIRSGKWLNNLVIEEEALPA